MTRLSETRQRDSAQRDSAVLQELRTLTDDKFRCGRKEIVKLLQRGDGSVNYRRGSEGDTALIIAARWHDEQVGTGNGCVCWYFDAGRASGISL